MNLPTCVCGGKTSTWSIKEGTTTGGVLEGISLDKTTSEADPDGDTVDSSMTDTTGSGMEIGKGEVSSSTGEGTGKSMGSADIASAAKVEDDGVSTGSIGTTTGSLEDSEDVTGSVSGFVVGGGGLVTGSVLEVVTGGVIKGSTGTLVESSNGGGVIGSLEAREEALMGLAGSGSGTGMLADSD